MGVFTATTRIPTRPLGYDNAFMRYAREVVVDYSNGMIYISDNDCNLISVAAQVYRYLLEEGDLTNFIANFIVKIPKPGFDTDNPPDIDNPEDDDKFDKVVLPKGIFQAFLDIEIIKNNLKTLQDKFGDIIDQLSKDSKGTIQIHPNNIKQDTLHQFLTQDQINCIARKVEVIEHIVTVNPSNITGSGTTASPYVCNIALVGADPDYPSPDMSVSYTAYDEASRNDAMSGFSCINRFQILEKDKGKLTFNTKPTKAFNVKVRLFVPGLPSKPAST